MPAPNDTYLTGLEAACSPHCSVTVRSSTWHESSGLHLYELQQPPGLQEKHLCCRKFGCSTLKRLLATSTWCICQRLLNLTAQLTYWDVTACTVENKAWWTQVPEVYSSMGRGVQIWQGSLWPGDTTLPHCSLLLALSSLSLLCRVKGEGRAEPLHFG